MPPRAVWKIRPSGVVPNLLMCARNRWTRTGDGDGAGLVISAVLQAAFLAGGALVGPGPPGPARDAEADKTIRPHPALGRCRSASRSMTPSDGRSAA
jgi:hypothetical protein